MAYRIDFGHSLEREVRRIAQQQITAAIDLLSRQPDGPHAAIHDVRKRIKRTRALYRLIQPAAKGFVERETRQLGLIAGSLGHLRDATAFVEATRYLQHHAGTDTDNRAIGRIAATLEHQRDRLTGNGAEISATLDAATASLHIALDSLSGLELHAGRDKTAKCLSAGWLRIDKKARAALALCADSTDGVPFHQLRKRSQDRWMHASLLHDLWPAALAAIQHQAKALVDRLGHEHDLAVLAEKITKEAKAPGSDEDRQIALQAITTQRQALQQACLAAGLQLFDKHPERDADVIALLIRH